MTDNPEACNAAMFPLGEYRVIELEGRDAVAFAQAQFMNDVLALAPGTWHWSGWLTPKGRVTALFALLRTGEDSLWILLADADAPTIAAQLRRFVFRSKLTISVRDDLRALGSFVRPRLAQAEASAVDGGAVELDMGTSLRPRCLRLTPIAPDMAAPCPDQTAAWHVADLRAGLPRLPASELERWTPQQLSLDRLRAFSVKKGCYPGQEIVARTHFLGQAKRGLVLFEAQGPIEPGAAIEADGGAWGSVVSSASAGDDHAVLGVGSLERPPAEARAGGIGLVLRPFEDGLAR